MIRTHLPGLELFKPNRKKISLVIGLVAIAMASGCSTTIPQNDASTQRQSLTQTVQKMTQDRDAIRAMAGNYKVTFDFTETVPLQANYTLKDPKLSGAHEVVRIIRDEPGFISLQHILVVGGDQKFPIKHWRQDWIFEPEYVFDFVGFNSWKKRELTPRERKGKWAQFVYQVDDSPRYSAAAEWAHENGLSTWTSPQNMRPLPRRDMTTRDDYHAVMATNRHVITPFGWVHEQDNTKLVLTGDTPKALVREVGVNTYTTSDAFDAQVAETYWTSTQDYWAGVRGIWSEMEAGSEGFGLTLQGEPTALYRPLMDMTDKMETDGISVADAVFQAANIIETYTTHNVDISVAQAKEAARDAEVKAN